MAKITTTDLTTLANDTSATNTVNLNSQALATELNDKVLYRNNPVGEPNQMENDLDLNSNDILNVASLQTTTLKLNGQTVGAVPITANTADKIIYEQGGTGDVQSTVEAKLRERITPADFGAAGDSVTNDTTALVNALTEAAGRQVDLAGLTYLTDKITYSGNVHLVNGTLLSNTVTDHCLNLSGSNIYIDSVKVTSSFSGTGDIAYKDIHAFNIDTGAVAPAFTADSECTLVNCKAVDYRNTGFYIAGYDYLNSNGALINNLGAEGIRGSNCNNVKISNSRINAVYGGGIQHTSGGDTKTGMMIIDNQVRQVYPGNATFQNDSFDHGIGIEVNSVYQNTVISGNFIEKTHSMGLSMSSASAASITGNNITKVGQSTRSTDSFDYRGFASMEITNSDWCDVVGNKITDPYASGIVIDKSHYCNFTGNHFHNSQGVTRTTTQYFIRMTGSANDLNNSSYGNTIDANIFDNGGANGAGQADELCYAVYNLLNGFGNFGKHFQSLSNNKIVDCIARLSGEWTVDGNTIFSNGILDISTSGVWAQPLLHLSGETAPNNIRNCTYVNINATKTTGFVLISSANINNLVVRDCYIENTEYVLFAGGGFLGALTVKDCHLKTMTGLSNRGKNGSNYYLDVQNCTGDRFADAPRVVYGPGTAGVTSPIDGDIVYDITPRASGKIGWAYDGNAAAWKQFGVIDA